MPSYDLAVSYNDAAVHGWTSGHDAPTNQAMKRLVAAITTPHHVEGKGVQ